MSTEQMMTNFIYSLWENSLKMAENGNAQQEGNQELTAADFFRVEDKKSKE